MVDIDKIHIEKVGSDKGKNASTRQLRVGELIREVIAEAFSQRIVDAKIFNHRMLSVNKVKISSDLQNATIFISSFPSCNQKELIAMLNQLAPRFRAIINRNIKLKYSPAIIFRYDDTLAEVSRINSLIDSLDH